MRNPHYKQISLLSIASAVRLIEQPKNAKERLPDFDEHGFPVMSGTDEFYKLLTNFGKDKIVVMTFAPHRSAAADDSIVNWTFFVRLGEDYAPEDQLVLKQNDSYLICFADERERFAEASVFGTVAHKSNAAERDEQTETADELDEFNQSSDSPRTGWRSPFRSELERAQIKRETLETHCDYEQDFGA